MDQPAATFSTVLSYDRDLDEDSVDPRNSQSLGRSREILRRPNMMLQRMDKVSSTSSQQHHPIHPRELISTEGRAVSRQKSEMSLSLLFFSAGQHHRGRDDSINTPEGNDLRGRTKKKRYMLAI
jgi:hypothetical protein